ncbi:MAG TPA: FkbM family methyltransferase [Limnobacter sp.]|uniref:FkbM family methyltransferase n=1 Tax=Limnobacter sp. TaxID=2003368 RepID=UPI002ED8CB41
MTPNRCRGVVVEPLPDLFEHLTLNYQHYPAIKPIRVAIHPTERAAAIYRVAKQALQNHPDWARGIASFNRGHLLSHRIPERDIEATEVACQPLMELILENHLQDLNYLQVDTEGFDHEILKQLDLDICKPGLIKFEKVHMPKAEYTTLAKRLRSYGYQIIDDNRDGLAVLQEN